MLQRIVPADYARVAALFAPLRIHLAVASALAGETPADLYVDDPATPQAGVLFISGHRVYLAGTFQNDAFLLALKAQLSERGRDCVLYADRDAPLQAILRVIPAKRMMRSYYAVRLTTPLSTPTPPDGYRLRPIDAALVADTEAGGHMDLVAEMCSEAPSVAAFLAGRFGFCLEYERALVSWCLSEYNHAGRCEIGIATQPDFQRRGLATLAAQATMARAQAMGITEIGWHCWQRNIPSGQLAQRLGLQHVTDFPVWRFPFEK
jgi:GNAT superfamily N-acetyltransferase